MKNISFFNLGFGKILMRFYLMMMGSILLGFLGYLDLAAIWAATLAMSCILGFSFTSKNEISIEEKSGKLVTMEKELSLKEVG